MSTNTKSRRAAAHKPRTVRRKPTTIQAQAPAKPAAATRGPGRPRMFPEGRMVTFGCRLPACQVEDLDNRAAILGTSRGDLVRKALGELLGQPATAGKVRP